MLLQLNKCVVVCGSDLQREHSGDGYLTSSILYKYERSREHLFGLSWARVLRVAQGSCFGVMYCEWYGVCDFVVLSVIEVCVDPPEHTHRGLIDISGIMPKYFSSPLGHLTIIQ